MDLETIITQMFGNTENIWDYIKRFASTGTREVTRIVLQMYYCLMAPTTPMLDKIIIVAGLGYQLLPTDLLPRDRYKFLGYLDNGVSLSLAYSKVRSNVTPKIANHVETILNQWFGTEDAIPGAPGFIGAGDSPELPKGPSFPSVIPSALESAPRIDPDDDLIVD